MSKAVLYIVSIGLIWLIVCGIRPYWNKYWINSDLKAVALYGTKHSTQDTRPYPGGPVAYALPLDNEPLPG